MTRIDVRNICIVIACGVLWIICAASMATEDSQGVDFYPLWTGASVLSQGQDPYAEEVSQSIAEHWNVAKEGIRSHYAVSYPLPALIPFVPLTFFSFAHAVMVWKIVLLLGVFASAFLLLRYTGHVSYSVLPFLYYPIFHAYDVKNPALLWYLVLILTLTLLRTRHWLLSGVLLALLPAKPQAGLLLAALYYWMSFQEDKRHLYAGLLATFVLWGGVTVLFPSWPLAWLQIAQDYQEQVRPLVLLPTSLLLLLCSYRLSLIGIVAVTQVILFPVTDIYVTLPLLIAFCDIRAPIALGACVFSWIAPCLYEYPNDLQPLWLTLFLPFALAAVIGAKRKRPIWVVARSSERRSA